MVICTFRSLNTLLTSLIQLKVWKADTLKQIIIKLLALLAQWFNAKVILQIIGQFTRDLFFNTSSAYFVINRISLTFYAVSSTVYELWMLTLKTRFMLKKIWGGTFAQFAAVFHKLKTLGANWLAQTINWEGTWADFNTKAILKLLSFRTLFNLTRTNTINLLLTVWALYYRTEAVFKLLSFRTLFNLSWTNTIDLFFAVWAPNSCTKAVLKLLALRTLLPQSLANTTDRLLTVWTINRHTEAILKFLALRTLLQLSLADTVDWFLTVGALDRCTEAINNK